MARKRRLICVGFGHHITQRGNDRQQIFFSDQDRTRYLDLLVEHAAFARVQIVGYCLMTNHTHLVLVPTQEHTLERCMQRVESEYASRMNLVRSRSGHLWQGRYHCCLMDDRYLRAGLRYVEQNPVRAGMVDRAADWPWSSAREHMGLQSNSIASLDLSLWRERWGVGEWTEFVNTPTRAEEIHLIRRSTNTSRPLASEEFCLDLERELGRSILPGKPGRRKSLITSTSR